MTRRESVEKAAGAKHPLIPDDIAGTIFNTYGAVLKAKIELDAAKETAKEKKEALDVAQSELLEAIAEARSGQRKLFNLSEGGSE